MDNEFPGIANLITQNSAKILKRTSSGLHDHQNFKKLLAILNTYRISRALTGYMCLLIEIKNIETLVDNCSEVIHANLDSCIKSSHNHIVINDQAVKIKSERSSHESTIELKRAYSEMSREYCIFVIKPEEIHYFLDGDDVGDALFFTKEDVKRYKELKDIDQINELFEDYRIHLTLRGTYHKFFVSNSGKNAFYALFIQSGKISAGTTKSQKEKFLRDFLLSNKQLLENKPEDRFREDLRGFLNDKFKGTIEISKEPLLESFKRIDILIRDEYGDLSLIEVKWVGKSIHASGNGYGTVFDEKHINPEGVKQAVNYIKELYEHKKDIKIAYLAVFDARDTDSTDTVGVFDINNLDASAHKYYHQFVKLNDFKVINSHPN